ncbi:MAG: SpoIID/LytB domain-containing protein [Ruminiclostridium sp.]|nr:SpoIID/LytB domain-containing protein [Ruminiclostridium sp.]
MYIFARAEFKKTACIFISILFLLMPFNVAKAQFSIPETIKVGLYYSDPSVHVNTAVASFDAAAKAGLSVGFYKDNSFTPIYENNSDSTLVIRKDSYFTNSNGSFKEYDPNTSPIPQDQKAGPFHIILGTGYSDMTAVYEQVYTYTQKGIQAYPVFTDTWQVGTGFYLDQNAASQDIPNITAALGEGSYEVMPPADNRIAVFDKAGNPICLFSSDTAYFRVMPEEGNDPRILTINGKAYRGALEVRRLSGSDMTVINVVNLQEYLYGNVPPEIGGNSHPEALKAQAMAAKMYAINSIGKHKKTGFDVCATTHCQVYKGYGAETKASNDAINKIADKVITYNGKLAGQIYYFASSAGRTEDSENVWGFPYPYLKSVEDKYEPVYSWTKTLRASDVMARIPDIGNVLGMSILKTSQAGRVTQLAGRGEKSKDPEIKSLERARTVFSLESQLYTIVTDADVFTASKALVSTKSQIGGKKVLSSSGIKTLKSSTNKAYVLGAGGKKKTVALVPETYTFTGKGWGHAVGMSQEGARSMGKAGFKYDEIITHYFSGTKIE